MLAKFLMSFHWGNQRGQTSLFRSQTSLFRSTTYGYDDLSRNTSTTDAEGGVTSFAFDAVSNMLSLTDPVGNTTTWTYDALNQMLTDMASWGQTLLSGVHG